jgi:uncharacterized protein (TIGR03067 family)
MRYAIAALLVAAVGRADDKKDEVSKLDGRWDVVALTGGGKPVAKDKAPPPLTIKAGVLSGLGPDMKLTTDATKKPKWLNMTFTRDKMEMTVNAIYELEGDALKICLPLAKAGVPFQNERPAGFDTKDKPEMLIELKRAK